MPPESSRSDDDSALGSRQGGNRTSKRVPGRISVSHESDSGHADREEPFAVAPSAEDAVVAGYDGDSPLNPPEDGSPGGYDTLPHAAYSGGVADGESPTRPVIHTRRASEQSSDLGDWHTVLGAAPIDDNGPRPTLSRELVAQLVSVEDIDDESVSDQTELETAWLEDEAGSLLDVRQAAGDKAQSSVDETEIESVERADEDMLERDYATEIVDTEEPAAESSPDAWSHSESDLPYAVPAFMDRLRLLTALAAGAFAATLTYSYLRAHDFAPEEPSHRPGQVQFASLDEAMERATGLITLGAAPQAGQVLESALARFKDDPSVPGAELILLEARYKSLPAKPDVARANAFYAAVDDFVYGRTPPHPGTSRALYWKAKVYEKTDDPFAARAAYREILEDFGGAADTDETLLAIAELELRTDRPQSAVVYLQRLLNEFPASQHVPRAHLLTGDAYAATGDDEAARIRYISTVQQYTSRAEGALAFERLGRLGLRTGDEDAAIRDLESRLATDGAAEGNGRVRLLLARAYRTKGDYTAARATLDELLETNPDPDLAAGVRIELSQVLTAAGSPAAGLRMALRTAEEYPRSADAHANAARLLADAGRDIDAAESYLKAYDVAESSPGYLIEAGRLFRSGGDSARAHAALTRLIERHSNTREARDGNIQLARVELELGRVTRAVERLERHVRTASGQIQDLTAVHALAETYRELGLDAKAAATYEQAAILSQQSDVWARAALAFFECERWDDGLDIAKNVTVSRLDDATAYTFLNAWGKATLRRNPASGLEIMERAAREYPAQRTGAGDRELIRTNLAQDRPARAMEILSELKARDGGDDALVDAAILWGDHLFEEADYRGAAEAYTLAVPHTIEPLEFDAAAAKPLPAGQAWAAYQKANALNRTHRYAEGLQLLDQVARSGSKWSGEARARAAAARIALRLSHSADAAAEESG